jgi:hypothetical protein
MKQVAKYNTLKGVSTALTIGTPIVSLVSCGDFFVHRSDTAISAAGVFTLLIVVFLFKDKFAENFKMPSAFILSLVMFILLLMVEKIILPMKYVCIATMIATGADELTFKRFYKQIELMLPAQAQAFKHLGFIFTTTKNLEAMNTK